MHKLVLILAFGFPIIAYAQEEANQDWNAFYQKIDIKTYAGRKFRVEAFVKAEVPDNLSSGRLWARVDTRKGWDFLDNMHDRPIVVKEWKKYTIQGTLSNKARFIEFGGIYFGFGKYYYDDFSLSVQRKDSTWEQIPISNSDFEGNDVLNGWKYYYLVKGYEAYPTLENPHHGVQSLVIDGSKRAALSYGHNQIVGKFANVNGIKMYYEIYGTGEPLLLIHGNGQSISAFKYQIPEFLQHYRVIALDSRGQGNSTEDGTKLTYELMAEDVNTLLDSLGLNHVNVVGWSDGGNIGLLLAMKHPDKVMKLATMGANLYNDNTSVDPKINKAFVRVRAQFVKENKPENAFKIQLADLVLHEPNIKPEQLKVITCPTLVMAGSNDAVKGPHTKLIADHIPHSKLVIFEKGGHYEPQNNPVRFNKTVIDFLGIENAK